MSGSDFWTRRRSAVEAEQESEERARTEAEIAAEHRKLEDKTDQEILAELDLPDPEELEPGDDFSVFMKAAVPERLKRRALRRLWSTNPLLANLDGLVEYGEDYTDAATVVENLTTAYQVGKGMTKHVEEMLRADGDDEVAEGGETPDEDDVANDIRENVDEHGDLEEIDHEEISENVAEEAAGNRVSIQNDSEIAEQQTEEISWQPGRMRYSFDVDR